MKRERERGWEVGGGREEEEEEEEIGTHLKSGLFSIRYREQDVQNERGTTTRKQNTHTHTQRTYQVDV